MDPDPDPDHSFHIKAQTLKSVQIPRAHIPYILACRLQTDADPDPVPDPVYHFDADPYADPVPDFC